MGTELKLQSIAAFDRGAEERSVVDLIHGSWTGIPDVPAMVRRVFDVAWNDFRFVAGGVHATELSLLLGDTSRARCEALQACGATVATARADHLVDLLSHAGYCLGDLEKIAVEIDGKWDLGQRARRVLTGVRSEMDVSAARAADPSISKARVDELFKGVLIPSVFGVTIVDGVCFSLRESEPRRAFEVLVDEVYAHALKARSAINVGVVHQFLSPYLDQCDDLRLAAPLHLQAQHGAGVPLLETFLRLLRRESPILFAPADAVRKLDELRQAYAVGNTDVDTLNSYYALEDELFLREMRISKRLITQEVKEIFLAADRLAVEPLDVVDTVPVG